VDARQDKGRFVSFEDFVRKSPAVVCNKRTIESLIKGGSFDSLQHTRQGLVRVHEAYIDALVDEKRQEAIGQDSLFGGFSFIGGVDSGDGGAHGADGAGRTGTSLLAMPPIPTVEWDKSTLLAFEREMLGLYVSDHPLFGIEHILAQHADTSIAALTGDDSKPDGANVTIAGLITALQIKRTKKGDLWAIVTVEDLDGAIECLFFPSAYMTVSTMLGHDVVCVVRGRLNRRDETPTIFAQELTLPDIKCGPRGPVVVTLPLVRATNCVAERIKRVLGEHPGVTEVHLKLTQPGRSVLMRLDDSLRVTASPALFGDLKALLGSACLS